MPTNENKPYNHPKYHLYCTPRRGVLKPLHERMNGKEAGIIELTIGERSWLCYKDEEDTDFFNIPWHRILTSPVESVEQDENGNIYITTENTVYQLIKAI